MKQPLVSIVVPCYNVEKYIVSCLESICAQTYRELECILVNDGSTDHTEQVIREFLLKCKQEDISFKFINGQNEGAASARNKGLMHAKGKYVSFVDSDDWVNKDYIMVMVERAEAVGADLCVSGYHSFYQDNQCFGEQSVLKEQFLSCKEALFARIDELSYLISSPVAKLYSVDILNSNGIRFDDRMTVMEDLAFNIDVYSHINNCVTVNKANYYYRIHADSLIHGVTIPTKCKYSFDHFVQYYEGYTTDTVITNLKANPNICQRVWEFGCLDRIQAAILEKDEAEAQWVLEHRLSRCVMACYCPQNRKDRILFFLFCNRKTIILRLLIQGKYFLLKKMPFVYQMVKKRLKK